MSTFKKRVDVDEGLLRTLEVVANYEKHGRQFSRSACYVTSESSLCWLVEQLAVSSQFTSEQQAAFQVLLANRQAFLEKDIEES